MNKTFNKQELTEYSKDTLIELFMMQQKLNEQLAKTNEILEQQRKELNTKLDHIMKQLNVAKQQRFGRSSEKQVLDEQLDLIPYLNEAESLLGNQFVIEPGMEEVVPSPYQRRKVKGKREADLKGLPVEDVYHTLSEEKLQKLFGIGNHGNNYLMKNLNA